MGWFLKKSFGRGPVRLNLSKSGLGVSMGVKGLRLGTGPRGSYVAGGREGLYFRKSLSGGRAKSPNSGASRVQVSQAQIAGAVVSHGTQDIGHVVADETKDLVDLINTNIKRFPFWIPTLVLGILLAAVPGLGVILMLAAIPIYLFVDLPRKTTTLEYQLDGWAQQRSNALRQAIQTLGSSQVKRIVTHSRVNKDRKYSAGAGQSLGTIDVQIGEGRAKFLKTNVPVPFIRAKHLALYFLPDYLYVYQQKRYGVLPYGSLDVALNAFGMIESRARPNDAQLLGHTWSKVNKDGSPDKRFKDNRQLPKYRYADVNFTDGNAFRANYNFSNVEAAEKAVRLIHQIGNDVGKPAVNVEGMAAPPVAAPATKRLQCPGCKQVVTVSAAGRPVCPNCGYGKARVAA